MKEFPNSQNPNLKPYNLEEGNIVLNSEYSWRGQIIYPQIPEFESFSINWYLPVTRIFLFLNIYI